MSMGGAAPLASEGQMVAGVGVSGGTVDQDVAFLNRRSERRDPEADHAGAGQADSVCVWA